MATDELIQAYADAQQRLWKRWMDIASRFEMLSSPENAWWSSSFKLLDAQVQEAQAAVQDADNIHQAWLNLWKDSLRNDQGIIAGMIEWNRRLLEQQAEANRRFLNAWAEITRDFQGEQWDAQTRGVFEELETVLQQALTNLSMMPQIGNTTQASNEQSQQPNPSSANSNA
jgi:hypothetical protein